MISTPQTHAEDADLGSLKPERLDTNQQTLAVPVLQGEDWFALTWIVSRIYNPRTEKKKIGGKGGKGGAETVVYSGDVAGLVCCGAGDEWLELEVNGKTAWVGSIGRDPEHGTGEYAHFSIAQGTFRLHWGTSTGTGDFIVLNSGGEQHPYYRDFMILEAKGLQFGASNTPPNIRVRVARTPRYEGLDVERTREGINPVTAVAEILSNDFFGLGLDVVDLASANGLANALRNRTRTVAIDGDAAHVARMSYLNITLRDRQSFQNYFTSVFENFDGWARQKGDKIEFGFFERLETAPDDLPELTLHDMAADPEFDNPGFDDEEVLTNVIVTGPDRDWNFEDSWEPGGNIAAYQRLQDMRQKTFGRPFICTAYQRREQANELATYYSTPGGKLSVSYRREKALTLRPGDRFIANYSPNETRRVYRVLRRRIPADEGVIEFEVEVDRAIGPLTYVPPADPVPALPEPPSAEAITEARLLQLPAAFAGTSSPVLVPLAVRPTAPAVGFDVYFSPDGASYDFLARVEGFALRGVLASTLTTSTGIFTVSASGDDIGILTAQSAAAQNDNALLLIVGYEIISLGDSTALGGGSYEVEGLRGRLGSSAATHSVGDEVYIIRREDLVRLEHAEFPRDTSSRFFKLATYNPGDEQQLADALEIEFTFADSAVSTPISFVAEGKAESIAFTWTNPSDPELSHIEIFECTVGSGTPGDSDVADFTFLVRPDTNSSQARPLGAGVSKDYYARLVDTGGFKSAFVGPQTATAVQAGQYTDFIFKRASSQPATPTGDTPSGWSDGPPTGTDPLWMSRAEKTGAGVLIGTWSTPVRLDGQAGADAPAVQAQYSVNGSSSWHSTPTSSDYYMRLSYDGGSSWTAAMKFRGENGTNGSDGSDGSDGADGTSAATIYVRAASQPSTPTGNSPVGWSTSIPSGDGAVWASTATKSASGTLIGSWSTPRRISGSVTFAGSSDPAGSNSVQTGDIWFDTSGGSSNIRIKRRNAANTGWDDNTIDSLAVSKLLAGTIQAIAITLAGGGTIKSSDYVAGSAGWSLGGTGGLDVGEANIRGKINTGASCYNPGTPSSTFPMYCAKGGVYGVSHSVTGTERISLVTVYGWATGSGFATNRFGKSTMVFTGSFYTSFGLSGSNYADLFGVYRINGGSWNRMTPGQRCVATVPGANVAGSVEISGLSGTDVIEFGIEVITPSAQTYGNGAANISWGNL